MPRKRKPLPTRQVPKIERPTPEVRRVDESVVCRLQCALEDLVRYINDNPSYGDSGILMTQVGRARNTAEICLTYIEQIQDDLTAQGNDTDELIGYIGDCKDETTGEVAAENDDIVDAICVEARIPGLRHELAHALRTGARLAPLLAAVL